MPYAMNPDQYKQVLSLSAKKRYDHFIAKVADWEELWTLKSPDGFVLLGDDSERKLVPVWPHPDYAVAMASGSFSDSHPHLMDLNTFLSKWIPGMIGDGVMVAVFPTPEGKGPMVEPQRLGDDLAEELQQCE